MVCYAERASLSVLQIPRVVLEEGPIPAVAEQIPVARCTWEGVVLDGSAIVVRLDALADGGIAQVDLAHGFLSGRVDERVRLVRAVVEHARVVGNRGRATSGEAGEQRG